MHERKTMCISNGFNHILFHAIIRCENRDAKTLYRFRNVVFFKVNIFVPRAGIEPATVGLRGRCSTN